MQCAYQVAGWLFSKATDAFSWTADQLPLAPLLLPSSPAETRLKSGRAANAAWAAASAAASRSGSADVVAAGSASRAAATSFMASRRMPTRIARKRSQTGRHGGTECGKRAVRGLRIPLSCFVTALSSAACPRPASAAPLARLASLCRNSAVPRIAKSMAMFQSKSSFFRGNSLFFLHFQWKKGKLAYILQFAVPSLSHPLR